MICLVVSMRTINWDRGSGVLSGTKWLKKWEVFLWILNKTNPIQKARALLKVISMWAVIVKMYGIRPAKLKIKIVIKKDSKILILPFWFFLLRVAFNSCSIKLIIVLKNVRFRGWFLNSNKDHGRQRLNKRML